MSRIPVIPTILVAAAAAAMIALGIWQIGRAHEKDALIARYAANRSLPPIALPTMGAADESLLYRRATAFCLQPTAWRRAGGRSVKGTTGTRFIASCSTGAEGPGFAADMGVSADPRFQPHWAGGEVTGVVIAALSDAGVFRRFTGKAPPQRPMIVAANAAPGLEPTAPPEPPSENTSRGYAGQWFLFAATAAIIYAVALRRRRPRREPEA
jgi:cytochrome oxidase assembly protein ShyY1